MTLFHKGESSRRTVQHKKMTSDQVSVCIQREDKRMEQSEDECSWRVGL